MLGAETGKPGPTPDGNQRRLAQRLDVVHHRRATLVTLLHRIGWANPGNTAPAFERLEQRRLLSADVGTGTADEFDV
ncbi:MAG TPA: hypothetical protein DIT03_11930, partial [Candidatus Accumulibacter sp.]|nr:hypothetical protein [Accumulibacter sp.]